MPPCTSPCSPSRTRTRSSRGRSREWRRTSRNSSTSGSVCRDGQLMRLHVSGLQKSRIRVQGRRREKARRTFMSFWALATEASVRTCWMTAFFTEVESMFAVGVWRRKVASTMVRGKDARVLSLGSASEGWSLKLATCVGKFSKRDPLFGGGRHGKGHVKAFDAQQGLQGKTISRAFLSSFSFIIGSVPF